MPTKADVLTGKLAVAVGFATPKQVEEMLAVLTDAEKANIRLSLAHVLLKKGIITSMQFRVLNISTRYEQDREQDVSLARFMVRNNWMTETQAKDLLTDQEPLYREGKPFERLQRLVVEGGVLTPDRVEKALKLMGGMSDAVKAMASSGLTGAVPAEVGTKSNKRSTLRTETLELDHCKVQVKRHVVKDPAGKDKKVYVLEVSGQLDAHSFGGFDDFVATLIQGGRANLAANFSKLTYISSAGIGALAGAVKSAREKGGDFKLCCLQGEIKKVIDLVGFERLLQIFATEPEAVNAFKNPAPAGP